MLDGNVPPVVSLLVLSVSPGVGDRRPDTLELLDTVAQERAWEGELRVRRPDLCLGHVELQPHFCEDLPEPFKAPATALGVPTR